MAKITFIGAGSTVFARNLLGDILGHEELAGSEIALFDIDAERLATSELVARRVAEALDAPAKITATVDRRAAFDGADYAINMIQVGGYEPCTVTDFEVPKQFGLRQTIADTLGIGGIMRGLRTIPVMLDMCRDMEALCPDVWFLNYTNPMAINCRAVARASSIRTVGLCHSVQGTAFELSLDLGIPYREITYRAAGINHMAFYLEFSHHGEDLYPRLLELARTGAVPEGNRVRYEVLRRLGYFVTESSEHFAEYVPWFVKRDRPDLIESLNIPLDEYPRRCVAQIADWDAERARLESGEAFDVQPSFEYAATIIRSIETGKPRVIYGNVPNAGLIDDLPAGCTVEVPCLVNGNGVQPTHIGALPPQLAALIRTNVNVQELTVEAALTGRREHVYHAAMMDPHTAAELDLDQIHQLVDALLDAHGAWIPELT
ncbi:MAG TPA: alpha-glucosidase/alpha-galactosidase [Acidimicrobiia bacterium]|jgi:alpha-galactosidase|nr:alpha-glucosidase/alpha-galactosidase [Acidimicrobiia bacterium]